MVDLSIVIVSWDEKEKLKRNLEKIYKSRGNFSYEVCVVDNNSSDGSAEMVRNEFPQVNLLENRETVGFAEASNKAITELMRIYSGKISKYVLLLKADMKIHSNTLINVLKWMEKNPEVGVAGCHLVNKDGETIRSVRKFPHLMDQLVLLFGWGDRFPKIVKDYLQVNFDYSKAKQVSSISGGFFMMNTWAFKNRPLLDEEYYFWFEEIDFCRHMYKYNDGSEVWYTPVAECVAPEGSNSLVLPSGEKLIHFKNSQLRYFRRWAPYWQYIILRLAWIIRGVKK